MRYFYRTLRMALHALRRNVMRSALTTLGIVIGVAAVIAMTEIGQGSASTVQKIMQSMGANNLLIQPGTASSGGVSFGSGTVTTLTPQDAEAVARDCPAVAGVAPVVRARTQVIYGNRNWVPTYIYGTTPSFLDVRVPVVRVVDDERRDGDRREDGADVDLRVHPQQAHHLECGKMWGNMR